MEHLCNLVANYSITVPFALKKLGERQLSKQDFEEIKNFIALSEFHRDTQEITDTWESMETMPFGDFTRPLHTTVCIFFKSREIHKKLSDLFNYICYLDHHFSFHGIFFFPLLKQFMIEHKNEIHRVFLVIDSDHKWHNNDCWGREKSERLHYLITPP